MRIAVNLRQFYKGKIGGMENYVRNILARLQRHSLTIWVHEDEVENVRAFAPRAEIVGVTHQNGVQTIEKAVRSGGFDLFFCPLLVLEPLVVDIPSAVMMPDVQHEFYPDFFEQAVLDWRRQTYGPTALNTDVLFTLSEHAKSTIVEKFDIDPGKITVVHLDVDDEYRKTAQKERTNAYLRLNLPPKYLYFPANFWPHKNHGNVFQALRLVDPDIHLVLSGSPSGSEKWAEEARKLGIHKRVHFQGYLDKSLIPEVYRNALALLFATKFEGFGIPLLEAFHCRTPVITSHSGSCVEVAADAAVTVDPLSPESIAAGITRLAGDETLRQTIVNKGIERAALFSWDRAAAITEEAFAHVTSPAYERPCRISVDSWPKIGIVTPTYNMAEFLRETIESILSQDYPHLDYVVRDAGSKDGTVELLKSYGDRIRWISEKDGGQGDAINKGWHEVSGDIFTFLNADDTYLPGALATAATHFKANPGIGMIYGEAYHVDITGKTIERYQSQPYDFQALNKQCYICQPAGFMLREAFRNAGMMDTKLHYALDYDLWIRIGKMYGIRKVDDYLATSRMHMDNKTLSSRRQVYQEILSTVKRHYNYAPYEWVNGYACYLLDKKDQYFDRSRPTFRSHALSLALGIYHNPHHIQRFVGEWRVHTGLSSQFNGRWEDGWISRRWESELRIGEDSRVLRIAGKHFAPIENLRLRIRLNGNLLGDKRLSSSGPFLLEFAIPDGLQGRPCELLIETDRTWRPGENGDYRQLSCIIDSLEQATS
ncbi:MAG TPA: glycosyltransferase [Bryobacteraceae bacterium]|nr:glycosyltransferase [Bryobacteraceae bacterium]